MAYNKNAVKSKRCDVGGCHKRRPYAVNKIAGIVAEISPAEYRTKHDLNPNDEACRLAEHVGSLFRLDRVENGKDGMTVEIKKEALTATALKILELDAKCKRLEKRMAKISDLSFMNDDYDNDED